MAGLPSGTLTFLFTDIEGSTKLAREFSDMLAGQLLVYQGFTVT